MAIDRSPAPFDYANIMGGNGNVMGKTYSDASISEDIQRALIKTGGSHYGSHPR